MKIEKEDGHVQAKERGVEQILPPEPLEGTNPADILSRTSGLQNCGKVNFCCLSYRVCGTLLQQP